MTTRFRRRTFLGKTAALAAAAAGTRLFAAPSILAERSPNSKLNIAGIGLGFRGAVLAQSAVAENLVALCDPAGDTLGACWRQVEKHYKEHGLKQPMPQGFADYREMFDKMHGQIDAVFVAPPDHHHALASMMAIKLGKHVYCEKPLTHTIDEARQLTLAARQYKVATQLGNQGRECDNWRRVCEWIWAGAIGDVQEVHLWNPIPGNAKKLYWPQGTVRPAGSEPVPARFNWDLWLGPAPQRPYADHYKEGKFKGQSVYHPCNWRGWFDFGTGGLGDQGCHYMSGTFAALKIEYAESAELVKDSGDRTAEMFPSSSIVRWDIPARAGMPPCKLFWYDGGYQPPREILDLAANQEFPEGGIVYVGSKGKMTADPRLIPWARMKDFKMPAPSIPRCASNHFNEWVTACKGGRPAFSNFDHGGPLTELVLLGDLAVRTGVGKKLQWDGPSMTCRNVPEVNQWVRHKYRKGWTL